jgi:hypothetical protein
MNKKYLFGFLVILVVGGSYAGYRFIGDNDGDLDKVRDYVNYKSWGINPFFPNFH